MTTISVEERLTAIEKELAELKKRLEQNTQPKMNPWLDVVFGAFKDDPLFEEAVRYGREYRESLRPENAV